jgi:hypothetical protein
MSAINGADEYSPTTSDSQSKEPNPENTQETSLDYSQYVPEREFVLMPLFRRIGKLFGLRRGEEPQYIAETGFSHEVAPEQFESQGLPSEERLHTAAEVPEPIAQSSSADDSENLLEIERTTPETVFEPVSHFEPQPESYFDSAAQNESIEEPSQVHSVPEEERFFTDVAPEIEQPIAGSAEVISAPAAQNSASAQQELRELILPLREAAAKISAAVAQAADWMRLKEEEIRQHAAAASADVSARHSQSSTDVRIPLPILPLEAHTTIAGTPVETSSASDRIAPEAPVESARWQSMETPGLQRELAWQSRSMDSAGHDNWGDAHGYAVHQPESSAELKPKLVKSSPRVPFWKRIDWAQEFTPRRVAVLGGLAMAVLLVLGVSLGRRPASSVLPQHQQQTRSLEPGGVTVTTQPVALRQSAPQSVQPPAVRPSPVARRAHRTAGDREDDGPEVVTHYYNTGKKPSPVKQTTVAGVKHYSDM